MRFYHPSGAAALRHEFDARPECASFEVVDGARHPIAAADPLRPSSASPSAPRSNVARACSTSAMCSVVQRYIAFSGRCTLRPSGVMAYSTAIGDAGTTRRVTMPQ